MKPTDSTAESARPKSSEVLPIGKVKSPTGLGISPSGEWLVTVGGHRVYVIKTSALKSGLTKFVSPEKLVSMAFHPTDDYFSTGDIKGVIRSWYCLKDELMGTVDAEKRAQTTTLHWHSHAVASLAFTPNGAYLLSAGEEAVLVLWQLHSGKKEFVPRVGAPITGLAVCQASEREEEYLMALSDGSHAVISAASLKISRSFARMKFGMSVVVRIYVAMLIVLLSQRPNRCRPAFCGRSCSDGIPCDIVEFNPPFLSPFIFASLHPFNRQTSPRTRGLSFESCLQARRHTSRTCSGGPMRYHVRWAMDGHHRRSRRRRESTRRGFPQDVVVGCGDGVLDVEHSHRSSTWSSQYQFAVFPARAAWVATYCGLHWCRWGHQALAAADTEKKSRERVRYDSRFLTSKPRCRYGYLDYWTSYSTSTFRLKTPVDASWSCDGSILAVTLETYVVLYDPESTAVLQVLTATECPNPRRAHFLGQTGRYLLVSGQQNAVLWDLIDQSSKRLHAPLAYVLIKLQFGGTSTSVHPLTLSYLIFVTIRLWS
jgi:NET1-associated nuclear protein 1 (U3 small nucleolar RNA-associated protein 17)